MALVILATSAPTLALAQATNPISTTTSLSSSANPSTFGNSITFKATVTPSSGSVTPSGYVIFTIDRTAQLFVPVLGGTATLSIYFLSAGLHTITETYSGDTNYAASTKTLTQTVYNHNCPVPNKGGANLEGANIPYCNLAGYDLSGDNLQDANMQGDNLQGANLSGANLQGANLSWTNLQGAHFF